MSANIDFFSHDIIAKKISTIFLGPDLESSFVVAINGAWGTGKTHLMNQILSELDEWGCIKVNFNAWRYADKGDIRRALLTCIIGECRSYIEKESTGEYFGWDDKERKIVEQLFDDTERALYTAFVKEIPGEVSINTGNMLKAGMNMALKFVPWGNFGNELVQKLFASRQSSGNTDEVCIEKEDIEELWGLFTRSSTKRNIEKIIGVEQFRKSFEILMKAILKGEYAGDTKREKLYGHGKAVRLVVAIDDLDRCLPEDALDVLEAIKLFVDYSNTYFMIAMDGNIIQDGLNIRYNKYDSVMIRAKDYYEKMIDLSFNIPALIREKLFSYIESLSENGADYIKIFDLLFIALNINLRAWQRYVHRTDFNKRILEEIADATIFCDDIRRQVFMKLQCLSYQWPELYRAIYDMDTYISLEEKIGRISDYGKKDLNDVLKELGQLLVPDNVLRLIIDKKITDFILMEPKLSEISYDNMNIFFTFDRII